MIPDLLDVRASKSVDAKAGMRCRHDQGSGDRNMAKQKKASTRRAKTGTIRRTASRREDSKQARVIALLQRPQGATVEEMRKATGWQPHTVRGAIAGAIKKKLGLAVASAKEERGRVYRIAARR
jgi:hypothetical protein